MSTLQLAYGPIVASGGVLDFVSVKANEAIVVLRVLSIVFAMGFILWRGIASRGAAAPIVISTLCAAFFIWAVWNVTAVKDRVNTEVNSGAVFDDRGVALPAAPPDARAPLPVGLSWRR